MMALLDILVTVSMVTLGFIIGRYLLHFRKEPVDLIRVEKDYAATMTVPAKTLADVLRLLPSEDDTLWGHSFRTVRIRPIDHGYGPAYGPRDDRFELKLTEKQNDRLMTFVNAGSVSEAVRKTFPGASYHKMEK